MLHLITRYLIENGHEFALNCQLLAAIADAHPFVLAPYTFVFVKALMEMIISANGQTLPAVYALVQIMLHVLPLFASDE